MKARTLSILMLACVSLGLSAAPLTPRVLTWRNYVSEHFGALPASTSSEDFLVFYRHPRTLFAKDIRFIK